MFHVLPQFLRQHPTLNKKMSAVPPNAIKFGNRDGSPLEILGYVRFMLAPGDITLPVEALVLSKLGPAKMQLANSNASVWSQFKLACRRSFCRQFSYQSKSNASHTEFHK